MKNYLRFLTLALAFTSIGSTPAKAEGNVYAKLRYDSDTGLKKLFTGKSQYSIVQVIQE